jgi:hypothetical protein
MNCPNCKKPLGDFAVRVDTDIDQDAGKNGVEVVIDHESECGYVGSAYVTDEQFSEVE